jgi:ribose/xylose/arabinose/galactoside ABC-type transport system permease subunit
MQKPSLNKILFTILNNIAWLLVIIAVVFFSLASSKFFTVRTLLTILPRVAALGLLVVGQSFVMLTGHMDLTSESVLGLTAFSAALMLASPEMGGWGTMLPAFVVVIIMLSGGAAIGAFNGLMITKLKLNNLVYTITMLMALRGIPYLLSNSTSASQLSKSFCWLGGGNLFVVLSNGKPVGFQVSIVFVILVFVIAYIITRYTQFGRNVYAVGASREAADSAGINSAKIIVLVYIISGLCSALAAWILAGRMGSATMKTGSGWIFVIQAAAIVGGVSLKGGRGNLIGAFGGVLLWGVLDTGLFIVRASPWTIDAIRGGILLVAVLLDAIKVRYVQQKAYEELMERTDIGLEDNSYSSNNIRLQGIKA